MKKQICSLLSIAAIVAFASSAAAQSHGHLNVGAAGTNQDDKLVFDESDIFNTDSGYVKTLTFTNGGTYAGYYEGNITLTALAATIGHPSYATNAPAFGSWIFAQLVSVDGPPGGEFAFWEVGATNPTASLVSGTAGTNTWQLSESDGSPGTDPYGHIHGRRFTATKQGVYVVGFRALDFSTNGVGGGPIQAPSDVLLMYFQAGDNIKSIVPVIDRSNIQFAARAGLSWQLQAASTPDSSEWTDIGDPVYGDDYFHEVLDDNPVTGNRFYRVAGTPIEP